jgi:hypothetical protein
VWPEKSNQKRGHPSRPPAHIRVRRAPAVLAADRPPNNSHVPVLKQFGYDYGHPALRPSGRLRRSRRSCGAVPVVDSAPRRPLRGPVRSGAHRARQKPQQEQQQVQMQSEAGLAFVGAPWARPGSGSPASGLLQNRSVSLLILLCLGKAKLFHACVGAPLGATGIWVACRQAPTRTRCASLSLHRSCCCGCLSVSDAHA